MPVSQESWNRAIDTIESAKSECRPIHPSIVQNVNVNDVGFQVTLCPNSEFWSQVNRGEWEPSTFKTLRNLLTKQSVYLDLGAWIGPTLLFGGTIAGRAIGFEPDPAAFEILKANLALNPALPLEIRKEAIAPVAGFVVLHAKGKGGDSESSVLMKMGGEEFSVRATTLEDVLRTVGTGHVVVKMDVEGAEFQLIDALHDAFSRYDIDIVLSLHPYLLRRSFQAKAPDSVFNRLLANRQTIAKYRQLQDRFAPFAFVPCADHKDDSTAFRQWSLQTPFLSTFTTIQLPTEMVITRRAEQLAIFTA